MVTYAVRLTLGIFLFSGFTYTNIGDHTKLVGGCLPHLTNLQGPFRGSHDISSTEKNSRVPPTPQMFSEGCQVKISKEHKKIPVKSNTVAKRL